MLNFLNQCNQLLWGSGFVGLVLGMGLVCLVSRNFACLRSFGLLFRRQPERNRNGKRLSVFQSCMTSLSASMGIGNIVGVATALTLGGAGAIFWMWVSAFCGMGLIYAENVLSCQYRRERETGAAAYLKYGLQCPELAGIFAGCCLFSSLGMGNMTQSHAMAEILQASFQIPAWVTGVCVMILLFLIVSGGAGRIAKVSSVLIPLLSGIYLLSAVILILIYRKNLSGAVRGIFQNAFGISAIGGGISGTAVKYAVSVGVRRGIFSNEAGLGSSGLLHGEADTESPPFLGLCGMLEVIADTFICCTVTALAILCTDELATGQDGAVLVLTAFRSGLGQLADWILPPVIALFAFCTLTGWCYCGMNALRYFTGKVICLKCYQIIFCLCAMAGTILQSELVWTLADIANACMAYCNLPAILLLYPQTNQKTAALLSQNSGSE